MIIQRIEIPLDRIIAQSKQQIEAKDFKFDFDVIDVRLVGAERKLVIDLEMKAKQCSV